MPNRIDFSTLTGYADGRWLSHAWPRMLRSLIVGLIAFSACNRLSAATVFEPAITGEAQPTQYILWDAGSGPNQTCSNQQLGLFWMHPVTGDYVDATGAAQGATPFASVTTPTAAASYSVDAAVLVARALGNGNKGFYLRAGGSGGVLVCSGRTSAHPPTLSVTTAAGTVACACIQNAGWSKSSSIAHDTRARFTVDGTQNFAVLRFDLSAVNGTVTAATLSVYVETRYGSGTTLQIFEADPPRFALGAGAIAPTLGLAAAVGETQLAAHPDVYMAGDFAGTTFSGETATVPKLFGLMSAPSYNAPQIIADPDAPGTVAWRGSFTVPDTNHPDSRQSFNGTKQLMVADTSDPLRPAKNMVDEAYYRLYFLLENDWNSQRDGNKMAITWDLRMGWWNDIGYWQATEGNGGSPGNGRRRIEHVAQIGADRYYYSGHMERMESGFAPSDGSPYRDLRPFVGYNYNLDQGTPFPSQIVYGNIAQVKFAKNRWVCVEQHLKMNSSDLANPDAQGNGVARHDGILETWVDGVKIDGRYDYRWRAHPQMGIAAVNSNWFYGGTQSTEVTQHYRLNHLVLAKSYIGPRVAPSPGNTAPTISVIADRSIASNASTGAIAFTVGDAQTAAGSLTLAAASSNQALAPAASVLFGGSGALQDFQWV